VKLGVLAMMCVCTFGAKIDPDTPHQFRKTYDNAGNGKETYILKFSDEFEEEGRRFGGGEDGKWTAVNSYNAGTADIEGYNQRSVTTKEGKLVITASNKSIVLDPSGTPRIYSSAMLQTWNRTCFRGGILEVSIQLPGSGDKPGMWPAVWMLGNLGRVAYGKPNALNNEVDGQGAMWPYSYDTCLPHSYPNYMPPNSYQRYDACNATLIPGYCDSAGLSTIDCEALMQNKALLQGTKLHGRGNPELDLLEVTVNNFASTAFEASLSTSLQIGPVTGGNEWIAGIGTCYDQLASNLSVGAGGSSAGNSKVNGYHGNYGSEVISALTDLPEAPFDEQYVYRMEWKLSDDNQTGALSWYMRRSNESNFQFLFDISQKALAGCGEVGSEYRTEDRPIPQEPMYLLMNLALANDFSPVPTHDAEFRAGFPYEMIVDYVRFYQHAGAAHNDSQCDSAEWPTARFIDKNVDLYSNPNITELKIVYNETLCNGTGLVNTTKHNITGKYRWYAYYDERCPYFGQISPGGCYKKDLSLACRQCYLKSVFERLAFTPAGAYGDSTSGQIKTTGFLPSPICPTMLCKAKGFPLSQCADEVLPEVKTCTHLSLKLDNTTFLPVEYCGNLAKNSNFN